MTLSISFNVPPSSEAAQWTRSAVNVVTLVCSSNDHFSLSYASILFQPEEPNFTTTFPSLSIWHYTLEEPASIMFFLLTRQQDGCSSLTREHTGAPSITNYTAASSQPALLSPVNFAVYPLIQPPPLLSSLCLIPPPHVNLLPSIAYP